MSQLGLKSEMGCSLRIGALGWKLLALLSFFPRLDLGIGITLLNNALNPLQDWSVCRISQFGLKINFKNGGKVGIQVEIGLKTELKSLFNHHSSHLTNTQIHQTRYFLATRISD